MPIFGKDECNLRSLQQLHKKTEEANNIMQLVLDTQRQLSDDNARQGMSIDMHMTSINKIKILF